MLEILPCHVCPGCGSEEIDRVPRRSALDHVMRAFGWRVYRCLLCGRRFYDGGTPTHDE